MTAAEPAPPSSLFSKATGAGPPVVLIHGLSGSSHWWSRNVEALAERYRTYAVDLGGFGGSRRFGRFRLDRAVALLLGWMDGGGIERVSVIGHSLGGLVAAQLAAEAPERVDRLILVDAAFLAFDPGLPKLALGLLRSFWSMPRELAMLLTRDSLRAHPLSLGSATIGLLWTDWRPMLSRIEAPTLVVWGERDTLTPESIGRQIAAVIPNARFVVIPGAGHNAMWDRPDEFNAEVIGFLG
jgi:pimeloyl-ACP methyl ester carboxylesterase